MAANCCHHPCDPLPRTDPCCISQTKPLPRLASACATSPRSNSKRQLRKSQKLGGSSFMGSGAKVSRSRGLAMRLFHLGLHCAMVGDMTTPPVAEGDLLIVSAGPGDFSTVSALIGVARKRWCPHSRRDGTTSRHGGKPAWRLCVAYTGANHGRRSGRHAIGPADGDRSMRARSTLPSSFSFSPCVTVLNVAARRCAPITRTLNKAESIAAKSSADACYASRGKTDVRTHLRPNRGYGGGRRSGFWRLRY